MDPARQESVKELIAQLGLNPDSDSVVELPCQAADCEAMLSLHLDDDRAHCPNCGYSASAHAILKERALERTSVAHRTFQAIQESGAPASNVFKGEFGGRPAPVAPEDNDGPADVIDAEFSVVEPPQAQTNDTHGHRGGLGENLIIAFLSFVFLGVGLLASAMSAFANFQAFGAMVDDPLQSRIWAWTGIIASICSFGGFTFAYWHGTAKRRKEALRAVVIALAGAGTSIAGTQMYMAGTQAERAIEADASAARAGLLGEQVEDWRRQLEGIPGEIRSVEGLEAYIAEVERIGRTNERPYRTALDELGQARRRADLETRIASAREELAALSLDTAASGHSLPGGPLLHWFFAFMLEVFSSQGTSIGFVALLILAGGRRSRAPPQPA